MRFGVSVRRSTASLLLPALRSHEPEASSPSLGSLIPATFADTACATETLGWHSHHALAQPVLPILRLPTSVRRSAVSPLPPTAVSAAFSYPQLALKCPRIPQVDTIASAHFGHHPHSPTLRPDGTSRTLTFRLWQTIYLQADVCMYIRAIKQFLEGYKTIKYLFRC